ncbi:MAG: carboxypeptidase-like regulatory domain-containing protein, partial [Acidobacteriota bacterium]
MRNLIALFAIAAACFAQNVSSSLRGVLKDPSGAAVAGVECRLKNQATGMSVAVKTAADGAFVFPSIPAGEYAVSVQAAGFKALEVKNIFVSSSEVRTLGSLTLEIGEVRDSVSVTAEPAAVQLASAEHSGVVTGGQLNEIALKGRDFFALPATIPRGRGHDPVGGNHRQLLSQRRLYQR